MMPNNLERDGFAIIPGVLGEASRIDLVRETQALLSNSPAGVRGIAAKSRAVSALAQSASVRSLIEPVLGTEARLVRSILFNKTDQTNWQVAWHQDLSIAVAERQDVEGYSSWSVKEGLPHAQPPVEILQQMLTVRLHLDRADETNGALWVSPGSHRLGKLRASEAAPTVERHGKFLCAVHAGDAVLMRPLLLHASRKATSARPRRVVHFEFCNVSLPGGLVWAEGAA